jgi:hypothetical protein
MVKAFLQLAGDKGVVFSEVRKGEPPVEFRMEGATWALISVYNVASSKFPVQGAYVEEDEFCYGMRDLDLSSLLSKYPHVKVSPMDAIRAWIEASEALHSS